MTHTKGEWCVDHIGDDESEIYAYDGGITAEIVCHVSNISNNDARANARRIVACVNALEGFDIAAIEAGVVKELVMALKVSQTAINDWLHSYAAEMCDEDDVKQSVARIGEHGTLDYIATVQAQNRDALAKIGGAL